MSAFCVGKLSTSTLASPIGVGFALVTLLSWSEAAKAGNTPVIFPSVAVTHSWEESGRILHAQLPPAQTDSVHQDLTRKEVKPVRIPEPTTLTGLSVVAGSLIFTRRRPGKKEI